MVKGDNYDHDLGHDYDNGFDLGHLKDIDTSNSHDGDECWLCSGKCHLCKVAIGWVRRWVGILFFARYFLFVFFHQFIFVSFLS